MGPRGTTCPVQGGQGGRAVVPLKGALRACDMPVPEGGSSTGPQPTRRALVVLASSGKGHRVDGPVPDPVPGLRVNRRRFDGWWPHGRPSLLQLLLMFLPSLVTDRQVSVW